MNYIEIESLIDKHKVAIDKDYIEVAKLLDERNSIIQAELNTKYNGKYLIKEIGSIYVLMYYIDNIIVKNIQDHGEQVIIHGDKFEYDDCHSITPSESTKKCTFIKNGDFKLDIPLLCLSDGFHCELDNMTVMEKNDVVAKMTELIKNVSW